MFLAQHSAKNLFAECPREYTWQTQKHSANLTFPVVNEVYHLMRLKHPNIVRFVGYCDETRNECVFHDGKYVFAEMPQKLVCLEYLPNGSLDRHVSGI